MKNITRDQNHKINFTSIFQNLLEYTLKQEYNKIEYTSNVEYTNYYSSNLNTGTFPLKCQLKKKKRKKGEKEKEWERKQTPGIRATWRVHASLNVKWQKNWYRCVCGRTDGRMDGRVTWAAQGWYSQGPEPTVNLFTSKKPTDLNYHRKCYMETL